MVHGEAWKLLMLLHYTGEEINDIFETLPDTGEENNYQAAIDALNAHFAPAANSEFSIYCFCQAKQQPNETLDTFHTRLQQLAMPCSFTDNDKEVKSQIIQACTSRKLCRSALQHSEWSLSNLLSSGRAMELANKHAADIEQPLEALSVNRIHACMNTATIQEMVIGHPHKLARRVISVVINIPTLLTALPKARSVATVAS